MTFHLIQSHCPLLRIHLYSRDSFPDDPKGKGQFYEMFMLDPENGPYSTSERSCFWFQVACFGLQSVCVAPSTEET